MGEGWGGGVGGGGGVVCGVIRLSFYIKFKFSKMVGGWGGW